MVPVDGTLEEGGMEIRRTVSELAGASQSKVGTGGRRFVTGVMTGGLPGSFTASGPGPVSTVLDRSKCLVKVSPAKSTLNGAGVPAPLTIFTMMSPELESRTAETANVDGVRFGMSSRSRYLSPLFCPKSFWT